MAKIKVEHDGGASFGVVTLTPPDENSDYSWECSACRKRADAYRPIDEAIMYAELHIDRQCPNIRA
jgi:hypothetical protein